MIKMSTAQIGRRDRARMSLRIPFNSDSVSQFCRRWQVTELSLFGSVLRDDFNPASDVDVLVAIAPDASTSYWDWPEMVEELERIFGRRVDLVAAGGLRNPFRKREILSTRKVIYAA